MNASFQGQYEDGFIEELKQDEWKLQQDAHQPESSQLWDLPRTEDDTRNCENKLWTCTAILLVRARTHLFLQVPSITQIKSDDLDQSHQDENGDEDKLVVVRQDRVLAGRKMTQVSGLYLD